MRKLASREERRVGDGDTCALSRILLSRLPVLTASFTLRDIYEEKPPPRRAVVVAPAASRTERERKRGGAQRGVPPLCRSRRSSHLRGGEEGTRGGEGRGGSARGRTSDKPPRKNQPLFRGRKRTAVTIATTTSGIAVDRRIRSPTPSLPPLCVRVHIYARSRVPASICRLVRNYQPSSCVQVARRVTLLGGSVRTHSLSHVGIRVWAQEEGKEEHTARPRRTSVSGSRGTPAERNDYPCAAPTARRASVEKRGTISRVEEGGERSPDSLSRQL